MRNAQINIRLDESLKRKFQSEVKKRGWDTTKLLTAWISKFVESNEIFPLNLPSERTPEEPLANFSGEREKWAEQINEKMSQLEQTIILLTLIHSQFLAHDFRVSSTFTSDRAPEEDSA
jgi:antitoxin component of RelBE/YafQ-DinJ toxin-antitoxin module